MDLHLSANMDWLGLEHAAPVMSKMSITALPVT